MTFNVEGGLDADLPGRGYEVGVFGGSAGDVALRVDSSTSMASRPLSAYSTDRRRADRTAWRKARLWSLRGRPWPAQLGNVLGDVISPLAQPPLRLRHPGSGQQVLVSRALLHRCQPLLEYGVFLHPRRQTAPLPDEGFVRDLRSLRATAAEDDETTDEATYRTNLETLVAGVREKGGEPVLVTPIVRRWFNSDGTLNNNTALLVNSLGVDHPAVIRSVAAAQHVPLIDLTAKTKALVESLGVEGSKAIYLYNEKKDNTHTSIHGATVYAGLVRDALVAQHLVPKGLVRVG
jgi:hypothetical protein